MKRRHARGFTLVELIVTVLIISILAAIAIPQYASYARRAQRKEAMAALQGLAQAMERFYAQNNTYCNAAATVCATVGGALPGPPAIFPKTAPLDGVAKYNLVINTANDTSYELEAQAIGDQQQDGNLRLKSTGERAWDSNHDGAYSAAELTWTDH